MYATKPFVGREGDGIARSDSQRLSREFCHLLAISVCHLHLQGYVLCLGRGVDDLGFHVCRHSTTLDVVVSTIDVCARGAQIGIERQGLIDVARHMQIDVLRQTAHVHVEVLIVPLVGRWCQRVVGQVVAVLSLHGSLGCKQFGAIRVLLVVGPVVVGQHLQSVLLTYIYIRCQLETEGHHAILMQPQPMPVQPHLSRLTCSLELDEHVLALPLLRRCKHFCVAACIVGQFVYVHTVCPVLVPRMGQRDSPSLSWILNGLLRVVNLPVAVEVEFLTLCRGRESRGEQCDGK